MIQQWHERFSEWSKPPTEFEEKKGSTAAEMINDALRAYPPLSSHRFTVYPTGSYRNNTNVRLGSDIDIAVVLSESFFPVIPSGLDRNALELSDATYTLDDFRDDVGKALALKFGSSAVTPGDITFNVRESSRRQDADVTPFLQHRCYTGSRRSDGSWDFHEGAETRPRKDSSRRIVNWHEQHYVQGVQRNIETSRRFKRITRILKRLRDHMLIESAGQESSSVGTPSFLIECLVYNVPDSCFNRNQAGYYDDVYATLSHLWVFTLNDQTCEGFVEVSRMKRLFSPGQAWTRVDAHNFIKRAYLRLGSEP
jgi:hypothetical protein